VHPFTTEAYLREVTIPSLERGLAKSDRSLSDFTISFSGLTATGENEQEIETAIAKVRGQIAFYGSTPSYRAVLELHGWGDVQSELNDRARRGEWNTMANLINDELLDAFALVGRPSEVASQALRRFDDVISRFNLYAPYDLDNATRKNIMERIR
jgi:alkanesulfonate monooxygenase SsuD/methylene tetrahydromethanopterin reductase-like flavin-dependent oxidoreductase (luciferase family)